MPEHRWFPRGSGEVASDLTLLCFPYAGGHWSSFDGWQEELPGRIAVSPVQYPRDSIAGAVSFYSVADLSRAAHAAVRADITGPVILYGHSLGALVAFEIAHFMDSEGITPLALIVSGMSPPSLNSPSRVHELPSAAFWTKVESWGGIPRLLLDDPHSKNVFEDALRKEVRLAELWEKPDRLPLACPIMAFAGHADPLVDPHRLKEWGLETRGPTTVNIVSGGHFFPFRNRVEFLRLLGAFLRDIAY